MTQEIFQCETTDVQGRRIKYQQWETTENEKKWRPKQLWPRTYVWVNLM